MPLLSSLIYNRKKELGLLTPEDSIGRDTKKAKIRRVKVRKRLINAKKRQEIEENKPRTEPSVVRKRIIPVEKPIILSKDKETGHIKLPSAVNPGNKLKFEEAETYLDSIPPEALGKTSEPTATKKDQQFALQVTKNRKKTATPFNRSNVKSTALRKSIEIFATDVFYKNYACEAEVVVNRGGTRSSKSYSIAQEYLTRFLTEEKKKILIVRKTLPALKISTYSVWKDLMDLYNVTNRIRHEKQNLNYFYKDNWLHFGALDDAEKIKSTEWNYIWMEEATEFTYVDYQALKLRISAPSYDGKKNQLKLSFNPIDENHWIKEKVLNPIYKEDVFEIVSTYKDNPFVPASYIKMIEELIHQDINFYNIYAKGEWGKLTNLIYSNWDIIENMPPSLDEEFYGLDFGYNKPSALVKIGMKDNQVFEEEMLYKAGLTNSDLITQLHRLVTPGCMIYADNAEPDRIEEISRAGLRVERAQKDVKLGIDFVKRYRTHLTSSSQNLIKEKRGYSWRQDRAGHILEEPVKFNDHILDAERYAIYTHLFSQRDIQLRWL